jgi:hypothetical protein
MGFHARMSIELFDVQAGFGGAAPKVAHVLTAGELAAEMREHKVGGALVRLVPESLDSDIPLSNAKLLDACRAHPELIPCPVAMPASGGDFPSEPEQVDAFLRAGARAVTIRPGPDDWLLADWMSRPLFAALEERRVPVLCLDRLVSITQAADMAARHPRLPLVLAELNYRQHRVLCSLLEERENVYLSMGSNYVTHGGIEDLVTRFGADRLLFGTGYPEAEMAAAISQLMYSRLSEEEKRRIGSGSWRRLTEGIA